MLRQVAVDAFVALVKHDEEEIETAHDGRAHVDVCAQRRLAVVPTTDWIRGREDGRARVERSLDAGFGDADGLLLHRFVDGDLVGDVHLVELVDGAYAVVREHEGSRFNGEFTGFFVPYHCGCEAGCGGRFSGRVYGPG